MNPIPLGIIGQTGPEFVRTHSRRTDPSTSHAAATRASRFASGQCSLILEALKAYGDATAKELGVRLGYSSVQVSRRLPDLRDAGLIEQTGEVRGDCGVWRIAK